MAFDPGADFEAPGTLLPDMRLLTSDADKRRGFLNRQARALNMPRGALWYSQNRGLNISDFIGDSLDPKIAEQLIDAELLKDEACARSATTIAADVRTSSWVISTLMTAIDGTQYQLVFAASAANAQLLTAQVLQ